MPAFEGVFFPGESFDSDLEDRILKRALIYFDKIYALVPEPFNSNLHLLEREYTYHYHPEQLDPREKSSTERVQDLPNFLLKTRQERRTRIVNFLGRTELLRDQGILQILNPRENIVSKPFCWNAKVKPTPWHSIKEEFDKLSARKIGVGDINDHLAHFLYGNMLEDLRDKEFRRIVGRSFWFNRVPMYKGQAEANWIWAIGTQSGFRADIPKAIMKSLHPLEAFACKISRQMWASLLINHALVSSFRKKAVPVCSHPTFQALMARKFERRYEKLADQEAEIPNFKKGLGTAQLALDNLPDFELASFEDVLEMRQRLEAEISEFRHTMADFAGRIKAEPYSEDFSKHLEIVKKDKVQPTLGNLRKKLVSLKLGAMVNTSIATALGIAYCIWPSLPPALSIVAGPSLYSVLQDFRKEYKDIKEKNGLSLLMKIGVG